jgi:PncC family amidohydrolase
MLHFFPFVGFFNLFSVMLGFIGLIYARSYRNQYFLLKRNIAQAKNEALKEVKHLAKQTKQEGQQLKEQKKKEEISKHKQVNKTKEHIIKQKAENQSNQPKSQKKQDLQNEPNSHCEDGMKKLMNLDPDEGERRLVSVAESCTAGLVNNHMCESEGASAWYGGGLITYHLSTKHKFLGVRLNEAHKVNCVSPEVAEEMSKGVSKMFNTKWGIATTGYMDEYFEHAPVVYYSMYDSEADKAYHGEIKPKGSMDRKDFTIFSSQKVYNIAQKLLDLPETPWISPNDKDEQTRDKNNKQQQSIDAEKEQ